MLEKSRQNNDKRIVLHKQISDRLIEEIRMGKFPIGERMPGQAELEKEYNVSTGTIRQALATLERKGIIQRTAGRGTFVSLQPSSKKEQGAIKNIGLIRDVSGYEEDISAETEVFKEFIRYCSQAKLRLIADQLNLGAQNGKKEIIETFEDISLDGLCLFIHDEVPYMSELEMIGSQFKSFVLLVPHLCSGSLPFDCIDVDLAVGTRQLMRFLLSTGHRRIACVGPRMLDEATRSTRWKVYIEEMERSDIPIDESLLIETPSDHIPYEFTNSVINLVRGDNPATIIFASNDWLARQIMEWLWKAGIRVPHDVGLCGLDDILARQLVPSLTTVAFPFAKAASSAIEILTQQCSEQENTTRHITLSTELVIRDSVLPVNAMKNK